MASSGSYIVGARIIPSVAFKYQECSRMAKNGLECSEACSTMLDSYLKIRRKRWREIVLSYNEVLSL